jgi:hypothetical protein
MLFRCVTEALVKDDAASAALTPRKAKPKGQLLVVGAEEANTNTQDGCC